MEIRKWRRKEEEKINKVYLDGTIWKTVDELRFGDGKSVASKLQADIDKVVTEGKLLISGLEVTIL